MDDIAPGSTAGVRDQGVTGDGVVLGAAGGGTVNLDGVSPSLADVTFDSTGGYTLPRYGAR